MNASAPENPDPKTLNRRLASPAAGVKLHAAAQTNEAAAQLYGVIPTGVLDPTEIVLLVVKPSAWMILQDSLRTFLIVASLTYLAVSILPERFVSIEPQLIYAVAASIMGLKVFWLFLGWVWRVYILTDKRVLVVSGVMRPRVMEHPLSKIQGLQVHHTFLERHLGLGTLVFSVSDSAANLLWRSVADPAQTAEEVWRLIERYSR
jgi:uncharacterized membrane protein YdbT with pleckstrin-like domain